jgi:DNA invertase Pin-like site-specific DNA recombinase
MKAALYCRVSTDGQSIANQRLELEAVAQRHGWEIVAVFEDEGISGAKGRDQRPAFDRLLRGVARREFDLVAAWSVDRLGRSLRHLLEFLGELQAKGVDLYIHRQSVDTSTPGGRALFGMLGVFAEFERSLIVERIKAGMDRARKQGRKFGRPRVLVDVGRAQLLMREGRSLRQTAALLAVAPSTLSSALRSKPPAVAATQA